MKKEYDTFVSSMDQLPKNQEIDIVVRDLSPGPRKYDSKWVRAIIGIAPEKMESSDVLWIRFPLGFLHPQPYAIKIVKVLGTDMQRK